MYDCPPSPPACTESINSVALTLLPYEGEWPDWTLRFMCGTGMELVETACDIEHNSVWGCITGTPATPDWEPLALDLFTPADGSGQVMVLIERAVHLRHWDYTAMPDRAVVWQCAGVAQDGLATSATCPTSEAPELSYCFGYWLPPFDWPLDLDGDEIIGAGDLLIVLADWGAPWDMLDMIEILANWGYGSPWT